MLHVGRAEFRARTLGISMRQYLQRFRREYVVCLTPKYVLKLNVFGVMKCASAYF